MVRAAGVSASGGEYACRITLSPITGHTRWVSPVRWSDRIDRSVVLARSRPAESGRAPVACTACSQTELAVRVEHRFGREGVLPWTWETHIVRKVTSLHSECCRIVIALIEFPNHDGVGKAIGYITETGFAIPLEETILISLRQGGNGIPITVG